MVECWKPVRDYEDLYQVSDRGRVRRIAGGQGARAGHVLRLSNKGVVYAIVHLYRDNRAKTRAVHTLVTEAFLGPCPDGLQVNHKNGNKKDNRVVNLEYVTPRGNQKHSFDVLGRVPSHGETHGRAKLTAPIVREIRRLYAKGGISQRDLAQRYGVARTTIAQILRRERWAHVA